PTFLLQAQPLALLPQPPNLHPNAAAPPPTGVLPVFSTLRTSTASQRRKKPSLPEDVVEIPPPHPFQTDFSPETLTAYMRKEVDKINHEREAIKTKAKGKQKETAAPAAFGLPDASLSSLQSDQFNHLDVDAG